MKFEQEYSQLKEKVESKENGNTVKFYRGHFLRFNYENLNIIVDFEKCTIESYVEINFMRYGEVVKEFNDMKDLYSILYFDYKQFFKTDSLASKTIVWIKQMFIMK